MFVLVETRSGLDSAEFAVYAVQTQMIHRTWILLVSESEDGCRTLLGDSFGCIGGGRGAVFDHWGKDVSDGTGMYESLICVGLHTAL